MTRLLVAMEDGLHVIDGKQADWTATERLHDRRLECVAATDARPDHILVGTFESGLQVSTDGGETFRRVGREPIDADAVLSIAVSPHDPDTVCVGTEPSAVYRSTDGGETWEPRPGLTDLGSASRWSFPPRPDTHHVRWIEPDPHESGRLYVGIEAGAFVRTEDGGSTWHDHPSGARRDNHTLATHPDTEGLVYTAAGDGFAVSRDGGDSWSYPQDGLDHRYCWSVVTDPGDPETIVLSAASGARRAHTPGAAESYVYRREGDGPWERIESDALATGSGTLRAVLATTGEPGVVYAATNHGLARSTDAGETWTALDVSWPERFTDQTCRGLAAVKQ
jgi:photosystem II stability/assembly factor-like uncharacterized protein